MKSQIHLIRHGITEGNQRRLYYGAADIPLAKEGERMLKELVAEHIYPEAEGSDFYTTGLIRTEQTLTLIYGEKEHSVIEELREMNFGQFEMKSYQELKEVPAYIEWAGDKTGTLASPEGESIVEFRKRIENGFDILMGRHRLKELSVRHSGKDAFSTVVCHGGTIASIMEFYFPGKREHFYKWIPDPGHGFTLDVKAGDVLNYGEF